jgi:DNA-binding NtrC family response regulator
MHRVLIIEDEDSMSSALQTRLKRHGFTVATAKTKQQAYDAFNDDPNFYAILVDGWMDGTTDTCDLIDCFRKASYGGHMIAMSSRDETRVKQMAAGCNHESWQKHRAANLVIDLFRREQGERAQAT